MDPSLPDADLVQAWRAGDRSAGGVLLRRHFGAVYRFLEGKVGGAAEDIAQRTFVIAAESLGDLREDTAFKAFLYGIARRQVLQHLQRQHRHARRDGPRPASLMSPSAAVARVQEHRLVLAALQRLPLELQIAIELYYWEQMPTKQIAHVLDVPQNTIKTRLHRARKELREAIETVSSSDAEIRTTVESLDRWEAMRRKLDE